MSLKYQLIEIIKQDLELDFDTLRRQLIGEFGTATISLRQHIKSLEVVKFMLENDQTASLASGTFDLAGGTRCKDVLADIVIRRLDFEATHPED